MRLRDLLGDFLWHRLAAYDFPGVWSALRALPGWPFLLVQKGSWTRSVRWETRVCVTLSDSAVVVTDKWGWWTVHPWGDSDESLRGGPQRFCWPHVEDFVSATQPGSLETPTEGPWTAAGAKARVWALGGITEHWAQILTLLRQGTQICRTLVSSSVKGSCLNLNTNSEQITTAMKVRQLFSFPRNLMVFGLLPSVLSGKGSPFM